MKPHKYLDAYTIQARLSPVLLVMLPLGFAIVAWFPQKFLGWGLLIWLAASCGMAVLLSEFGRDRGKQKEPHLFAEWGGTPTTQLLRHRDSRIDPYTKHRYHCTLSRLTSLSLPTEQQEANAPEEADRKYDSCVRYLRAITSKDRTRFKLIFKELVSYGFRRNLWGMKPYGISAAAIGVVTATTAVVLTGVNIPALPTSVAALILNGLVFVWWIVWITTDWVRVAAFSYAERLLAACDDL